MDAESVTNIKNEFSVLMRSTQHEINHLKIKIFRMYFVILICVALSGISMGAHYFKTSDLKSEPPQPPSSQNIKNRRSK